MVSNIASDRPQGTYIALKESRHHVERAAGRKYTLPIAQESEESTTHRDDEGSDCEVNATAAVSWKWLHFSRSSVPSPSTSPRWTTFTRTPNEHGLHSHADVLPLIHTVSLCASLVRAASPTIPRLRHADEL